MNRLNKIIALMLIFSFLLFGVTQATIEKDTSKKKTKKTSQNVMSGDSTNNAGLLPNNGTKLKRPQGYDDFIDKNNNGIDDRVEQKIEERKKDSSPGISDSNLLRIRNQNRNTNSPQRSSDDSVVKLKSR